MRLKRVVPGGGAAVSYTARFRRGLPRAASPDPPRPDCARLCSTLPARRVHAAACACVQRLRRSTGAAQPGWPRAGPPRPRRWTRRCARSASRARRPGPPARRTSTTLSRCAAASRARMRPRTLPRAYLRRRACQSFQGRRAEAGTLRCHAAVAVVLSASRARARAARWAAAWRVAGGRSAVLHSCSPCAALHARARRAPSRDTSAL